MKKTKVKQINQQLKEHLISYQSKFDHKLTQKAAINPEHDPLMDIYGITPVEKHQNAQYWGRQLGMLWERLIRAVFRISPRSSGKAKHLVMPDPDDNTRKTSPADLVSNGYGIDAKYRVGSGDSRFTKQFETSAQLIRNKNLTPTLLVLRDDNLHEAIHAATQADWKVLIGQESFDFIQSQTGFDLLKYLQNGKNKFKLKKSLM